MPSSHGIVRSTARNWEKTPIYENRLIPPKVDCNPANEQNLWAEPRKRQWNAEKRVVRRTHRGCGEIRYGFSATPYGVMER